MKGYLYPMIDVPHRVPPRDVSTKGFSTRGFPQGFSQRVFQLGISTKGFSTKGFPQGISTRDVFVMAGFFLRNTDSAPELLVHGVITVTHVPISLYSLVREE